MTNVEPQHDDRAELGLLGAPSGDLRFKLSWDAGRKSELIRLSTQKATVGSDPNRSVCLVGADVAPLECLVLHGAARDVVRWFDAAAAESGRDVFEDEVIAPGEQLRVGLAELEIVRGDEPTMSASVQCTDPDSASYLARLETLERQLAAIQRASGLSERNATSAKLAAEEPDTALQELRDQLDTVRSLREQEREHWELERLDFEKQHRLRDDEVAQLQADLQTIQHELTLLRAEQAELKQVSEDQASQLVDAATELQQRRQADADREVDWQSERESWEARLEENQEQLATLREELDAAREQAAELQTSWDETRTVSEGLQESLQTLEKQLTEREQSYESAQSGWESERQQLQEQLRAFEHQSSESATSEHALSEARQEWDREREALLAEVEEANERVAALEREWEQQAFGGGVSNDEVQGIADLRREFEHQEVEDVREAPSADLSATTPSVDDSQPDEGVTPMSCVEAEYADEAASPVDRFLSASSLIDDDDSTSALSDDPAGSFGAPSYFDEPAGFGEAVNDEAGLDSEIDSYNNAFAASDDAVLEGDVEVDADISEAPPVSTADVLARLGQSGAWTDEQEEDVDSPSPSSDFGQHAAFEPNTNFDAGSAAFEAPTQPDAAAVSTNAFDAGGRSAGDDEDESIEDYMQRLLKRVRGSEEEGASETSSESVESGPITEYDEVRDDTSRPSIEPAEVVAPATESQEHHEYTPTRQAPEAGLKDAMRDLANDTHRTAIASHAKRNWSSVMKMKLMVSIFAAVAVVASVIFFWGNPIPMLCGALAGLGVLGYWGWLAVGYRKLLVDSLMLEAPGPTRSFDGQSEAPSND